MKDIRYQRGKIYKLICDVTSKVYIGSTIQTLEERLKGHKKDYRAYLKGTKGYCKSFDIIENGYFFIELITDYPCWSKAELNREEGRYQRDMECINKVIAGRTKSEYYEDNKVSINVYRRQYYRDNKEIYQKRQLKNRDRNIKRMKQYYQDNKEAIAERRSQNFDCECGGKYSIQHRARHFKTKKHQNYLNSI